ncbi:MAG: DUF5063 domain-containing protein [Bacteroidales bacterium]|nr:DUF5063 domain-containing protein [Bacteroidales bacterium]MBR2476494.1 DUF5063 domain-containing protein [Bacteroidaceae bacterium]MBR3608560.1 DUF5063 domain-containing protein [Bacteroidales bacterium]
MDEYVYGKNSVEFVTVCVEYCALVEGANQNERVDFINKASKILPLLYIKASLITPEECFVDYPERFVSEDMYNGVRGGIEQLLGHNDTYLEVFMEGMQYSDTPITAFISEDLTDIWQPIRDFLEIYRLGDEDNSRAALTDCLEAFREYWGQKLVNVLRPLHSLLYNSEEEMDSEEYGMDYNNEEYDNEF